MNTQRVALLLIYRLGSPRGLEFLLQLHSDGKTWRFFGGHTEGSETPLHAAVREAQEELGLHLNPRELGEGWAPLQLLTRWRLPAGRVFVFPIEVDGAFPPRGLRVREGSGAAWWPVPALPASMSRSDKLLARLWMLRRQILNQPYIQTGLACPIVTIDLEEPHHYGGRPINGRSRKADANLPRIIEELLDLLAAAGASGTFFCVASTAQKCPDVLRAIVEAGHEVASHGMNHQLARLQTPRQFKQDVSESKLAIEDLSGMEVVGYRAPVWSCPRDPDQSERFYEVLREAGYCYSSSLIPSSIVGVAGRPAMPHEAATGVWEFPLPVFRLPLLRRSLERAAKAGRRPDAGPAFWRSIGVPYSGGLFMRSLGPGFVRMMLSYHLKKRGYAMVYAHPGELGGLEARWIRSHDDRYLNLAERWRLGYRSRSFTKHLGRTIGDCGGCSIIEFLRGWQPVSRDRNRRDEDVHG